MASLRPKFLGWVPSIPVTVKNRPSRYAEKGGPTPERRKLLFLILSSPGSDGHILGRQLRSCSPSLLFPHIVGQSLHWKPGWFISSEVISFVYPLGPYFLLWKVCVCTQSGCRQKERESKGSADASTKARPVGQGIKKDLGNTKERNGVTNKLLLGMGAELPGSAGVSVTFYLEEKCVMLILVSEQIGL